MSNVINHWKAKHGNRIRSGQVCTLSESLPEPDQRQDGQGCAKKNICRIQRLRLQVAPAETPEVCPHVDCPTQEKQGKLLSMASNEINRLLPLVSHVSQSPHLLVFLPLPLGVRRMKSAGRKMPGVAIVAY